VSVSAHSIGSTRFVASHGRNAPMLEDTVDDGVVLLIADAHVDVPATAQILDVKGSLLASHTAF
jgi:hypothetical protein